MHVSDYVSGIIFGALVGILARLVLPGRQSIGGFITVLIGIGAAVLGTLLARVFNVDDRAKVHVAGVTWSWWVLGIQVGLAVIGVALAQLMTRTPLAESDRPRRRRRAKKA
jgi:uncharacterized membrane protein YeaQ/YmgE (transglycosylase-associated protein family)